MVQGLSDYNNGATERRFSPYSDNGGSVVAIAGEDFCVIASDTRFDGNEIASSETPDVLQVVWTWLRNSLSGAAQAFPTLRDHSPWLHRMLV